MDQVPDIARVMLHGVGELMLVRDLPRMVRHLKARGTYVLFNTNGTLLTPRKGCELAENGLDELRVSFDAADTTGLKMRGKDFFDRISRNVRAFTAMQAQEGFDPAAHLHVAHRPARDGGAVAGLRTASRTRPGSRRSNLQRLVFFEQDSVSLARPAQALFKKLTREEAVHLEAAERLAASLSRPFSTSGTASEAGQSLKRADDRSPWSLCRCSWSVTYFTANGRALPCCIAPFSQRGYEN